jgi:hypothetical protein
LQVPTDDILEALAAQIEPDRHIIIVAQANAADSWF